MSNRLLCATTVVFSILSLACGAAHAAVDVDLPSGVIVSEPESPATVQELDRTIRSRADPSALVRFSLRPRPFESPGKEGYRIMESAANAVPMSAAKLCQEYADNVVAPPLGNAARRKPVVEMIDRAGRIEAKCRAKQTLYEKASKMPQMRSWDGTVFRLQHLSTRIWPSLGGPVSEYLVKLDLSFDDQDKLASGLRDVVREMIKSDKLGQNPKWVSLLVVGRDSHDLRKILALPMKNGRVYVVERFDYIARGASEPEIQLEYWGDRLDYKTINTPRPRLSKLPGDHRRHPSLANVKEVMDALGAHAAEICGVRRVVLLADVHIRDVSKLFRPMRLKVPIVFEHSDKGWKRTDSVDYIEHDRGSHADTR